MARKEKTIVIGFREVRKRVPAIRQHRNGLSLRSPAEIMAAILKRPQAADRIVMYGAGDQSLISTILPDIMDSSLKMKHHLKRQLPVFFGYWLYSSILRFPGLLVNQVAAASYLNIAQDVFIRDEAIMNLFRAALYDGPFSDSADPLWWRGTLDDILADNNCPDGRFLVQKKLKRKVEFCRCSLNKKDRAGCYCMITKSPVNRENSRGNISFFPAGADLARVRKDIFDERALAGPLLTNRHEAHSD